MKKIEITPSLRREANTQLVQLKRHTEELERMGVTPRTKVLPPVAVRYVCERYGIDITNP